MINYNIFRNFSFNGIRMRTCYARPKIVYILSREDHLILRKGKFSCKFLFFFSHHSHDFEFISLLGVWILILVPCIAHLNRSIFGLLAYFRLSRTGSDSLYISTVQGFTYGAFFWVAIFASEICDFLD